MKTTRAQSATSLPRAPRDEASARVRTYLITMGVRIACFVLMVVVQPLGWYTWVFAAGAILLPYFAVVIANVGFDTRSPDAEDPEKAIEAPRTTAPEQTEDTSVIRLSENPPGGDT